MPWNTTSAFQALMALQRSAKIDRIIEEDSKRSKEEVKILFIEPDEFGNSTVLKLMKILHHGGFSPEERITYRATIYQNLLESAQALVSAISKLSIESVDAETRETADQIAHYDLDLSSVNSTFRFPEPLASSINRLWRNPGLSQTMERHGSEFHLMDNASYFFIEAKRIGTVDYIPNDTDILRCRQKSTGIVETRFNLPPLLYRIFDVGELRSERKWIHCFEGAISIIFSTALSGYDETLPEDQSQTRMAESLVLFDSIINSPWFSRTSIILLLTKIDVLRDKLPKVPLEQYFPEYTGGPNVNRAAKYIQFRFMQANRARLSIYPHLMQAIDISAVRLVFSAVAQTTVQNSLKDSGLL